MNQRRGRRRPISDDHPTDAPHQECTTPHGGKNVPAHCRCGARWPCPTVVYQVVRPQDTPARG